MAVVRKTLWNSVKELVLEQYKGSPNYIATVKAIVDETAQPLEDLAAALKDMLDVDVAEGGWLDIVGRLVGVTRNPAESDEDFRKRVKAAAVENSAGTPDFVIKVAKELSGDEHPQYMDEVAATFFVYTPDGRQLTRSEVDKTAPAGVLGLPGAAIQFADGTFMGDSNDKIFLAVADDDVEPLRIKVYLVTSDGEYIVTDAGKRIVGEILI